MRKAATIIALFAVMLWVNGCGTQSAEEEKTEKIYPFTLSENASIMECSGDNMYGLTSVIHDTDEDKAIWIMEFDKNTERDDAKHFELAVRNNTGIHGCNSSIVNVGASNRFFENEDYFYVYLFYKNTKDISVVFIENKGESFLVKEEENQIRLMTEKMWMVVGARSGDMSISQEYDLTAKKWYGIESRFWPEEIGFLPVGPTRYFWDTGNVTTDGITMDLVDVDETWRWIHFVLTNHTDEPRTVGGSTKLFYRRDDVYEDIHMSLPAELIKVNLEDGTYCPINTTFEIAPGDALSIFIETGGISPDSPLRYDGTFMFKFGDIEHPFEIRYF